MVGAIRLLYHIPHRRGVCRGGQIGRFVSANTGLTGKWFYCFGDVLGVLHWWGEIFCWLRVVVMGVSCLFGILTHEFY